MFRIILSLSVVLLGSFLFAEEFQVKHILDGVDKPASKSPVAAVSAAKPIRFDSPEAVGFAHDIISLVHYVSGLAGLAMLAIAFGQLSSHRDNPAAYPLGRVFVVFLLAFILLLLPFIPYVYD
ncbi:MAG: hypothetical protein CMF46_04235 [Legionellales bacterium]|nr:hypothetical protein [Legionellales bacterium]